MIFKRNHSPCSPLFQSLKILKFSYDLFSHQINLMNMWCHKRKHVFFLYKKFEINCIIRYAFLLHSFIKNYKMDKVL